MKTKKLSSITSILFTIIFILNTGGFILAQTPIKRPLVEEYTGTWCSSCGFGSVYSNHLHNNYPNAIMVAIHSGDVMENTNIKIYMSEYFVALPTFLYDRTKFPQYSDTTAAISAYPWATGLDTLDYYLNIQYNQTPSATIGIAHTYNENSREISITVTANFLEDTTGDFRLNCFILEDSVTGGSSYDQTNTNFSGWTGGPSYLLPLINSPSIISGYVHDHVLREMLGNPEGSTAGIPTSVNAGSSYNKTFTYTIPVSYRENHIQLVGVLQNYGQNIIQDRTIINANTQNLSVNPANIVGNDIFNKFIIYPNPLTSESVIEFYNKNNTVTSCNIYDSMGKLVINLFDKYLVQGEYIVNINASQLSSGIYFLRMSQNGNIQTEIFIIK